MRSFVLGGAILIATFVPLRLAAQSYPAPSRSAAPSTAEQEAALRAGAALHDQGKYAEAIAKYEAVLKENPANATALYELAFSYAESGDHRRSLETARRGAEFKTPQLSLFYDLIASALDSMGQPQEAIAAYRKGIEYAPAAANLYYNMAVTYFESLKNPDEARRALEKAVALEPTNADAELMLGRIFEAGGYRTPAFFALAKFLLIRPAGADTLEGYGAWRKVLRAGMDPVRGMVPADGAMQNVPQRPSRTDEGNFADIDRQLAASHLAALDAMDKGKPEIQALVAQVDSVLGAVASRSAAAERSTFVWTNYAPYFIALKQKNYVEPFVYWVSQRAPVPGVREWLEANEGRVREFLNWTLQFKWPAGS